jgi:hypothetical protein
MSRPEPFEVIAPRSVADAVTATASSLDEDDGVSDRAARGVGDLEVHAARHGGATGVAAKSWGVENRINAAGTKARTAGRRERWSWLARKEATGDK